MAAATACPSRSRASPTTPAARTSSFRATRKWWTTWSRCSTATSTARAATTRFSIKGRYVKYPFENGLYDLDPQDRFECLYHYIKNDYPPPKTNFKEWIYHHFGKGLAEKYLIPYNEKIWNVPAEELGLEWVEGRVPKPPLEDVIKAAVGVETEGYTHQLYYNYPSHGGIEALPRALAKRVRKITPDFNVGRVWKEHGQWCVTDGRTTRRYEQIVSTIPIQELVRAVSGTPEELSPPWIRCATTR